MRLSIGHVLPSRWDRRLHSVAPLARPASLSGRRMLRSPRPIHQLADLAPERGSSLPLAHVKPCDSAFDVHEWSRPCLVAKIGDSRATARIETLDPAQRGKPPTGQRRCPGGPGRRL